MNFDELRRQAENHLGKDIVNKAEKVIRKKIDKAANSRTKELIEIEDVNFKNEISDLADEAKERLKGKPELQSSIDEMELTPMEESKGDEPKIEVPNKEFNSAMEDKEEGRKSRKTKQEVLQEEQKVKETPTGPTGDSHSAKLLHAAVEEEYRYGRLGLGLGLSCIIAGVILGLNGVAGSTSWTAKLLALESEINDAAPGVLVFVVGIFMVWITKPKVKMKNLRG